MQHPGRAVVLFSLMLVPACGVEPDTTIDVAYDPCVPLVLAPDGDTTDEQRRGIGLAAQMWNEAAGTRLTLADTPGAKRLPVRFEQASLAFRGLYDDERGVILVNQGLTDAQQRAVVIAHEMGHAFGLGHVDGRPSLMNRGNLDVLPTADDVATLSARWGRCADRY